jgi:4-hydroxy-3-polyprenylbenzoate decarboxylase
MGAIILPPVPAFYAEPHGLEDIVDQIVGKALDLIGLNWYGTKRWGEDLAKGRRNARPKRI